MNTFGRLLRLTTFGESHGPAMGGVLDGLPAGFNIDLAQLKIFMGRRRPGTSDVVSPRNEPDEVEILSGVYQGRTLGTPLAFVIKNTDQRSQDYQKLQDIFRPGHADYTYQQKYGFRDPRGGGRASARETVARVAAGAIASQVLNKLNISLTSVVWQIGEVVAEDFCFEPNRYQFADSSKISELDCLFDDLKAKGDSVGARILCIADGVPAGLGEPIYHKMDANLASAMMGINAVKSVAIGDGADFVTKRGSQSRDPMTPQGFSSNHAGGITGGITTGQPIVVDVAFKATSSVRADIATLNTKGEPVNCSVSGRHDPCVAIRAPVICESMMALVLLDHLSYRLGEQGLMKQLQSSLSDVSSPAFSEDLAGF